MALNFVIAECGNQVGDFGVEMDVAFPVVFGLVEGLAPGGVDEGVPEVEEIDVVELLSDDFPVYGREEGGRCGVDVDVAFKVFLDGGIVGTVFLWAEPPSNFGDLIDLFRFVGVTRGDGLDLLPLVLR